MKTVYFKDMISEIEKVNSIRVNGVDTSNFHIGSPNNEEDYALSIETEDDSCIQREFTINEDDLSTVEVQPYGYVCYDCFSKDKVIIQIVKDEE